MRIHGSSRIVEITISSPKAILVAFIKSDPSWRVLHRPSQSGKLAEKPKVGKLQMDWLRSEDLKEEKNVTASIVIIPVSTLCRCQDVGRCKVVPRQTPCSLP